VTEDLPMPTRYIIDSRSIIRAADVNTDTRFDPRGAETFRFLKDLVSSECGR